MRRSRQGLTQDYTVVERDQDFTVYRKTVALTNDNGSVSIQTNEFTVLDHGMNYLQNGEWRESQDLVESFADGAIARYGAYQTIFSPDLNSEAVFDISTPDSQRIRGGVRAIQLTDVATGKSVAVATVKKSTPGEIVPPNNVSYRSAFEGLEADVLYVWKHNAFSQNLILKENLAEFPAGLDPATTRLEVVSELVETPEVTINKQVLKQKGQPDLVDDGVIGFGKMLAIPGMAFPVAGGDALNLSGPGVPGEKAVRVLKQFQKLDDGRPFILESVGWEQIEPQMRNLPTALRAENSSKSERRVAQARVWPEPVGSPAIGGAMLVASVPYSTKGYLVDLELLSGSTYSKTFNGTTTYYIPSTYWVTNNSTFQDGTVIKLGPLATLTLSGYVTSPPTGIATLTSRDDNTVGERIVNAGNPPYTSDGVVSAGDYAYIGLSVYNVNNSATFQRFRVRYTNHAIDDYSSYMTHTVQFCRLEYASVGVYGYYTTINMVNNELCNVTTSHFAANPAYYITETGTITECGPFHIVASFAGIKMQENQGSIPDTMGTVGPSHFMVVLNDGVAAYNKYTGVRRSPTPPTTSADFFRVTVSSGPYAGTYPTASSASDPRILYDHDPVSQRWVASALDVGSRHVLLAVSNGPDPVGNGGSTWVANNWTKYLVPLGGSCGTDYDTLGVDSNAIYIGIRQSSCEPNTMKLAALPKSPLLDGSAQTVQGNFILEISGYGSPKLFPAVNFDPITIDDPAWFLFGQVNQIYYNRLRWLHGFTAAPEWEFSYLWPTLTISDSFVGLGFGSGIAAPQLGSTARVALWWQGSDLMTAVARKVSGTQYLWTCHQIGVNNAGNNDSPQTNPADRSAIGWYKIQTAPSVMISDSGRIFDGTVSSPKFYYMPSLTVNKNGDMVIGFSGSSAAQYISAYYAGRLNNGTSLAGPVRYFTGKEYYLGVVGDFRWGDYSHTSLDTDGLTIWTIQEYAETRFSTSFNSAWGTWIGGITPF